MVIERGWVVLKKKKIRRIKLSKAWSECSLPLRFVGLGDKVFPRLLQEVWGLNLHPQAGDPP